MRRRGLAGLVALAVLGSGCTALRHVEALATHPVIFTCPDGAPSKVLQHPSCPRGCGYSCLPDRWSTLPEVPE
jgi:hypothetical protein